ncbi:copper transporter [Nocardiopsis sp. FR4]|uniref:copper transporter n=1 Tax=Nocardiopsis sp. FR4 TaxID=2605985 RepID=UPI00135908FC|nr:copper transporter [Nocardiopsis sp. FR4]
MIDFRYHLVSIIGVFLALTVGLVLGTTMLQDPLLNTLQSETADLRGQADELRAERDVADRVNAGADEMAEAVSGELLSDLLADTGVAVVSAPGAAPEMADALARRVEQADGEVVARIQLSEAFLDAGNATFIDELSLQIAHDPEDLTGSPYEKAGAEIGRALAAGGDGTSADGGGVAEESASREGEDSDAASGEPSDAASGEEGDGGAGGYDPEAVLEAFSEGGLLTVEDAPAEAADAVLVIAPEAGAAVGGDDQDKANAVLGTLTAALHEEVGAAVVAGDGSSARGQGMIAQARAEEARFATVDTAGRPMGEVVTILALAEALEEDGGAYGVGEGVRGFLPDPLPEPRRSADGGGSDGDGGRGSSDGESSDRESSEEEPSAGATDGRGTDEARRASRDGG